MMNKYIFFFFWFFLLYGFSAAQFSGDKSQIKQVRIPEKNIENYKKQKEFVYEIKTAEANIFARAWDWIKRQFFYLLEKLIKWIFGAKKGTEFLEYIIKALPYIGILIFIYLIFRLLIGVDLIKMGKNAKKNLNKVYLSDEERIIQEEDLNNLIAEAIRDKQYRLAVRYYYLSILKQLIDNGLIEWHNEKTNRDYVKELSQNQFSSYFNNLTFIYDYVWYGNYQPAEKEFKKIRKEFESFSI